MEINRQPLQAQFSALEDLKQRNEELAILKTIAEELNRAVDVKSALANALQQVANLLGLKAGWVWLLDEQDEPYLAASLHLPPFLTAKPSRMRGKDCKCLSTFLAGDMTGAANVNVLECSRLWGSVDETNGLRYHASIPIYAHGNRLGVMNVASSDWKRLSDNDLQLLYIIGYQIGVAVERARLFDQSAQLAALEERNRLAREIHDTIAQGMAAVALNIESADLLLDSQDETSQARARQKLDKALALTRANLEEARRWVLDLRDAPYLEAPLGIMLRRLVENFQADSEMDVQFELKIDENRRFPSRIELAVYRIVQESLNNVQKHAEAETVRVSLTETKKRGGKMQLHLLIEDDGVGFDPASVAMPPAPTDPNNRWGLLGMQERVRFLGGHLKIKSAAGKGTRIEAVVPLE